MIVYFFEGLLCKNVKKFLINRMFMADALVNKINKSKTTIFFSKSTIEEMREHIKLALGVTEVKQYEKYLVLPLRG